ncbi:hypothetical protein FN846DRAFT_893299 [Sphaerosporella brunnea]|uniref:BZIP domain-containing protein n=1 Tax=Sphaerosporella brunnea TaxID=1250544 RepID=A0A5J5ELU8_9PEZI|nr:hypothetical protein FN846DRAFT_893299 [Sphaerosporella brunnea]
MTEQMKRERSSPAFSQENSFGSENIDSFLGFDESSTFLASPSISSTNNNNTRSSFSPSASSSSSSTPSLSRANPEFSAPSHPYSMHLQQTDPLGLDMEDGFFGAQAFMQLDGETSSAPPFFFPEQTVTTGAEMVSSQGISPLMTIDMNRPMKVENVPAAPAVLRPQPPRGNYYFPGRHQEIYNQNLQAMQAQKLARQNAAALKSPPHPQQHVIDSLLASFKVAPAPNIHKNTGDILPHIARMKKEEEDMDEDERLLASEEGKKLSSKERRQLRNKVSARAFRSRRKEYISQLEAEVAKKTQEAELAKDAARRLEEENTKLKAFAESLMKYPAFQDYLNEISAPLLQQQQQQQAPVTVAPVSVEPVPFNPARDSNPNGMVEEPQQQQQQWPLAYATNWNNAPHVYTVAVPEHPAIQDLDGKGIPFEEDYTIADGFFSNIRNEKADIDFSRMDEDEDSYQAPENLEDLFIEQEQEKQQSKNLDDLFPGVGVNDLLERLEMVAGGEARPEDLFEINAPPAVQQPAQRPAVAETRCTTAVNKSNRMLQQAEGVYRRIGLAVGGSQ